jgi:PAS domain S-box-containing protein/putative nucleotidyltransferase with HDIG domain
MAGLAVHVKLEDKVRNTIRKIKQANDKQTRSRRKTIASSPAKSKSPEIEPERSGIRVNTALTRSEHAKQLINSELRYRRLFETAQDGILILDAKTGAIEDVNPYLIDMLGYSREEFIAKKIWQVGAFTDVEANKDAFEALQKNEYIRYENLPLKAKNGRLIQVEFISNVYRVGDKKVIQCSIRNITEHKQLVTALRENERKYRTLVTQSPDGVFLIDLSGNFLTVNRAICESLGFSEEEFRSMNIWDIVPERYLEQHKKRLARILKGECLNDASEYTVRGTDGKIHSIEVLSAPYYCEKGIIGFQGIARDVTARKLAEEQIRQRLSEMEVLQAVSSALRTAQNRNEALPILLNETLTVLETDAGAIWLHDPVSGELILAVNRGWFGQLDNTAMKPGEGIAGTVFASGQAHLSTEFAHDPLSRSLQAGKIPAAWGGVCLPIRTGAITVGVLFVSVPLPRQITTAQVKVLELLAEMGGTALHRLRLREETECQLHRLEALHSIDIAITASMDLRVTLNVLLDHVKTQLNVDATSVLLLDTNSQMLEFAAGQGFRTRSVRTARVRLAEYYAGRTLLERRAVQASDPEQIRKNPHLAALWAGEGFAGCYGVPLIAKGELKGVLEVYHRAPFQPEPDWISFLETFAGQAAIAIDSAQLFEALQRSNINLAQAYDATIEGWSRALDLRDKETEGHTLRVTEKAMRLAKAMGISDAELVHIRRGGLLHDIGKMGVPDSILFKPGPLTENEWKVMRLHPQLAYDMLSPISYLRQALDIPYCHHEKWDGSGYPRGLKGEQIPFSARIFAVVDVWDALSSDRPYGHAWSEDKVIEHIRSHTGMHFDPQVAKAWLESGEPRIQGLE